MKPIAQTFYIDEVASGVPGVFITKVDLFFKSVSKTQGVELQIRTTQNGVPTQERLPFGSKILYPTDVKPAPPGGLSTPALHGDDLAAYNSTFIFDTPVFVESGKSYALVIIPLGGTPDYQIWTLDISNGLTDVLTGELVTVNNDTGDLFLSSNDRDWTPVITEDLKFNIYIANFTKSTGQAVIHSPNEEYVELTGVVGKFSLGEPLYATRDIFSYNSGEYNLPVNVITIAGACGTFITGDNVKQTVDDTSGGSITVTGKLYSVSGTTLKIGNLTGNFVADKTLFKTSNPSVYATVASSPTPPLKYVVTTASSNVVTVPDSSIFNVGDYLCIATNTYSYSQLARITRVLSDTTIQCLDTIKFTDSIANYSKVTGNGFLAGNLGAFFVYPDFPRIIIDNSTAIENMTFADAIGYRIFGTHSGASAVIHDVVNFPYNQISPQISHVNPANTSISWSFTGIKDITYAKDYDTYGSSLTLGEGVSNEFIDYERTLMSRSNEWKNLPSGRKGERTLNIYANLESSNTKISPVIDTETKFTTLTRNLCEPEYKLTGYYLNINTLNGTFANGDNVTQGTTTGNVLFANSSYVIITDVQPGKWFTADPVITVKKTGTPSTNALISSSEYFTEATDNGYFRASRYISKTVILDDTQNSEDIIAFLAAYRPAGTNLNVYAKIQHNQDSELWVYKHWSKLAETTPPSLLSSQININDQVELKYGFPKSVNLFKTSTITDGSTTITMFDTAGLSAGQFVYLADNNSTSFNVRQIVSVPTSSTIVVDNIPSFVSSDSAVGTIGIITKLGAFAYDLNHNIVRYVTYGDTYFDSYSTFAIKIVPVSTTPALVPRVGDMRVLALQA